MAKPSGRYKNRRRRGYEKDLPEKPGLWVSESPFLTALQNLEKKVDMHLAEKNLRIQEAAGQLPQRVKRIVKIAISHEHHWQDHAIDDKTRGSGGRKRFTHLVKSATILITERTTSDPVTTPVQWTSIECPVVADGFELKSLGNKDVDAKILLHLNRSPEKFRVSPPLNGLIGMTIGTRIELISAVVRYAMKNKLTDKSMKFISCNEPLKQVFNQAKIECSRIDELMNEQLLPLDPHIIDYKITVEGEDNDNEGDPSSVPHEAKWFDLEVEMPELYNEQSTKRLPFSQRDGPNHQKEVEALDEKMRTLMTQYEFHKRRRILLQSFAKNPVKVVNLVAYDHSDFLEVRSLTPPFTAVCGEEVGKRYTLILR
eukprot:jgi/Bigna1/72977/fgenesh1_pg.22_\